MYRQTYALVDGDVLKENVSLLIDNFPDYQYYFGIVKGNAYGHGDYVVNDLIAGGVNYLAASSLEECLSVRKHNSSIPVLCLEPIKVEYLEICLKNNISITIHDYSYYKEFIAVNGLEKLKVHLKIDSGMNRLGLKSQEEITEIVNNLPKFAYLEGIYSHFATSGLTDKYWDQQLSNFKYLTMNIDLSTIPIVHLGRSLTVLKHPKIDFCNGVRFGIAMYGFSNYIQPSKGLKSTIKNLRNKWLIKKNNISPTINPNINLKTAVTLYSEIIQLKKVIKGEFISYGANYIAEKDMVIGIIPIGYADGISLKLKQVAINGKLYSVVGLISMDMLIVEVDDNVILYNEVEIMGNYLPIRKVSNDTGINAYQLLTGITNRVPRIHIRDKEKKEIKY